MERGLVNRIVIEDGRQMMGLEGGTAAWGKVRQRRRPQRALPRQQIKNRHSTGWQTRV